MFIRRCACIIFSVKCRYAVWIPKYPLPIYLSVRSRYTKICTDFAGFVGTVGMSRGKLFKILRSVERCWIQKAAVVNCLDARGPCTGGQLSAARMFRKYHHSGIFWDCVLAYETGRETDGTSPRARPSQSPSTRRLQQFGVSWNSLSKFYQQQPCAQNACSRVVPSAGRLASCSRGRALCT